MFCISLWCYFIRVKSCADDVTVMS